MVDILLDSSDVYLSIGIAQEGKLLDFIHYEAWQLQSEKMIPELEKLLDKNQIDKNQIASFVVGKGPGSYTGVRIAMTIAKVGATTLHVPLYLVSSLEMMKDKEKPSICLMNARSKRSYVGIYEGDHTIVADCIMTNDAILEYINEHPDYLVIGDTKYLGIDGIHPAILEGMIHLKKVGTPCENPLGAAPTYLKDTV